MLLVGGAVRDLLLGAAPKDWDLLTSAHLTEVRHQQQCQVVCLPAQPDCALLNYTVYDTKSQPSHAPQHSS